MVSKSNKNKHKIKLSMLWGGLSYNQEALWKTFKQCLIKIWTVREVQLSWRDPRGKNNKLWMLKCETNCKSSFPNLMREQYTCLKSR